MHFSRFRWKRHLSGGVTTGAKTSPMPLNVRAALAGGNHKYKLRRLVQDMVEEVLLKMSPHTHAKHEILKKYLGAWFPILSKWNGRIVYLDGFAGPGEYNNGSYGSPIIALNVAKEHKLKLASEIIFYFIEKEKRRCLHLQKLINKLYGYHEDGSYERLPANFKIYIEQGEFNYIMNSLLGKLEEEKLNLAPTFAFIDPFGYSDIDVQILARVLKFQKCELLITYMVGFLDRFAYDNKHEALIKQILMMSDDELESIRIIKDKEEREEKWLKTLIDKVRQIIKDSSREVYSLSFRVKDRMNKTMYYVIHLTGHLAGVKCMKEAMWNVGKSEGYVFSDYNFDPCQKSILDYLDLDYSKSWIPKAADNLYQKFKGEKKTIKELEQYVLLNTPWIWRKEILKKLEEENKISVIGERSRKKTYPDGLTIHFI